MHDRQKRLRSVLIVEDDPAIVDLLRVAMVDSHITASADSGPDALVYLEDNQRPDVILLDYLLPGGGCLQVLQRAQTLGCAVVFMSGLPEALADLAAFGYPCLQKPFRITQLLDAIEIACARRDNARPL